MGEAALEGLEGVKDVTKGFSGFREINTVIYDASLISIDEMKSALIVFMNENQGQLFFEEIKRCHSSAITFIQFLTLVSNANHKIVKRF